MIAQTKLSRRRFLKLGGVSLGIAGMTLCGVTAVAPEPPPLDQLTYTFGETIMNKRLLIAYATSAGSTAEVAAVIGEKLGKQGYSVDVKPIQDNPNLDGYQAVLVGSAVQYGQWLPKAIEFVKTNQEALNRIPTALFCVHIQNLADDEESRHNRRAYLNEVRPLLQPVAEGYFAGKFDRRGAVLLLPGIFGRFMPTIDLRKWKKIEAWTLDTSLLLDQQITQATQAVGQLTAY